jgi:hypothetical protein
MAAVDESLVVKQGSLKKQGGFLNSIWQSRSFALKSGAPPKLLYSNAASVLWDSPASSEDSGCISLSSSSAAAANPGKSTDFTLSNVEYVFPHRIFQNNLYPLSSHNPHQDTAPFIFS